MVVSHDHLYSGSQAVTWLIWVLKTPRTKIAPQHSYLDFLTKNIDPPTMIPQSGIGGFLTGSSPSLKITGRQSPVLHLVLRKNSLPINLHPPGQAFWILRVSSRNICAIHWAGARLSYSVNLKTSRDQRKLFKSRGNKRQVTLHAINCHCQIRMAWKVCRASRIGSHTFAEVTIRQFSFLVLQWA